MAFSSGWERISQPVLETVESHWFEKINALLLVETPTLAAMALRSGRERISQPVLGTVSSHWFEQIKWPPIGRNSYLLSKGLEVRMGEDFANSLGNGQFSLVLTK